MQNITCITNSFHSCDGTHVNRTQRGKTGIDSAVSDRLGGNVVLGYHDGARTATTFSACQLGTREPNTIATKVLQQCSFGLHIIKHNFLTIEAKRDVGRVVCGVASEGVLGAAWLWERGETAGGRGVWE
eukprot:TRINITY_DN14386_c0_g1_i1.p1 TRINITY_DN14386_c0_g1~~TRINITY_DN14386_c0_g1_i1.p1  ORF type:complete len:129 (-),score=9.43 TRINITY_DN14386_c0_g1_i1:496-882(-)